MKKITKGEIAILIIAASSSIALRVFAFTKIFNLLVAKIFDISKIGYMEGLALMLFISFVTHRNNENKAFNGYDDALSKMHKAFWFSAWMLLFGYIVSRYI